LSKCLNVWNSGFPSPYLRGSSGALPPAEGAWYLFGGSFDGQVIALLRRHYGEDVDIAPNPAEILALAAASLADIPAAELSSLTRRLQEPES